jgi:hypothetical protein
MMNERQVKERGEMGARWARTSIVCAIQYAVVKTDERPRVVACEKFIVFDDAAARGEHLERERG